MWKQRRPRNESRGAYFQKNLICSNLSRRLCLRVYWREQTQLNIFSKEAPSLCSVPWRKVGQPVSICTLLSVWRTEHPLLWSKWGKNRCSYIDRRRAKPALWHSDGAGFIKQYSVRIFKDYISQTVPGYHKHTKNAESILLFIYLSIELAPCIGMLFSNCTSLVQT